MFVHSLPQLVLAVWQHLQHSAFANPFVLIPVAAAALFLGAIAVRRHLVKESLRRDLWAQVADRHS